MIVSNHNKLHILYRGDFMKCYICGNQANKKHTIGNVEYHFCVKCNKAYLRCSRKLKRARKGLYLVE